MSVTTGRTCRAVLTNSSGWRGAAWHDIFANSLKHPIMKFTSFRIALVSVATAGLFAFASLRDGSIHGTVSPADGGVRAWAESASDTVKAPIINGSYDIAGVKPGTDKGII